MLAAYDDTPPTVNTTPAARAAWNNTAATAEVKAGFERPIACLAAEWSPVANLASFDMQAVGFDHAGLEGVMDLAFADMNGGRFLIKEQANKALNGVYTYNTSTKAFTRDATVTLKHDLQVTARYGETNGGKMFKLTTADPITPGVTELTFAEVTTTASVALPKT